ncbi:MAG: lipopolysaccharide biosynthesis protein [Acholeplasmatales bacterium]|nr:lipopolysaccharide biosynthesis protein [Acholeplasmatales bacterium]
MINILFCGNDKVFDGMITTALSILKRSQTDEPFNFYIFTMNVTHLNPKYEELHDDEASYLDQIVKKYNPLNRVTKIDVKDIYMKEFSGCPNEGCYCSPYTLLRLFADIIPEIPDKILYLDVDIMLNRDIRLLYDIDITSYEYAAARDHYGKYLINPNYINAGVLLLNMKQIRQTGLLQKARNIIKEKHLPFADQSAIIRSTSKKKMLAQKFNDQKFLHKHTVIRHFSKRLFWLPYPHTANIKQWDVSKVHKIFKYYEFDDILYEYIYLKKKFLEEKNKENI